MTLISSTISSSVTQGAIQGLLTGGKQMLHSILTSRTSQIAVGLCLALSYLPQVNSVHIPRRPKKIVPCTEIVKKKLTNLKEKSNLSNEALETTKKQLLKECEDERSIEKSANNCFGFSMLVGIIVFLAWEHLDLRRFHRDLDRQNEEFYNH